MLVKYTVSEFLSAKGSFSSIDPSKIKPQSGPKVFKEFFMLNSHEREIYSGFKLKMPTIVDIFKKSMTLFADMSKENASLDYILIFLAEEERALVLYFSRADDWPKVLSLRTLLVRSVQHLVTYTKMFVCMSSFRIRLMTSSLMSTNRVTALEPYIPIITDY